MSNKLSITTRTFQISFFILIAFTMQFCQSTKTVTKVEDKVYENPISYTLNIAPILANKCSPCHFPEEGNRKMLNTYSAAQKNINSILKRVQLPEDRRAFMPFKSKKEPLTEAEIKLFKDWLAQGMPQ